LKPYKEEIKKLTGMEAFPGTLNVSLEGFEAVKFNAVKGFPGLKVKPFTAEGRSFGGARLYPGILKDQKVFVIIPDRTHYENVMEIICERNLRETLDLKDGDLIEVEVEVNCPQ
ncbi:MAG: CTP-dependent riboflavin kinase, partial [Thermoplasmata archaeon]|nr:CTP-dependent riboflavin kinase [Thermoplasmata archaeon]